MSGREHLSIYFYGEEERAFDSRPSGESRAAWVIGLAEEYAAGDWTLLGVAAREPSTPTKFSVSLPRAIASDMRERHPDWCLSDLLRTLVLTEAGLAVAARAPSGRVGSMVSVPLPATLMENTPGPPLDMLVRRLIREAPPGPVQDPLVRVSLSADTAQGLERIRGDLPPAMAVSRLLVRHAGEVSAKKEAKMRPVILSCDPRPYGSSVANGWPANAMPVAGPLSPAEAEEVARRLAVRPAHFWVIMDATRSPPSSTGGARDVVAEFHRSVAEAVTRSAVAAEIRQVNLPWGEGGLVAIANVSARA